MTAYYKKIILFLGVSILSCAEITTAPTCTLEQAKDVIAEAVAVASPSITNPNITVVLHPPVVVPAMSVPENLIIVNTSSMSPLEVIPPQTVAGTEAPVQNLAPEMFNNGFAMVNGTPVFLHASVPGHMVEEERPVAPPATPLAVVKSSTETPVLTAQEARDKDSASIAHSVMKAMEHLSNISQHEAANNNNPGSSSINNIASVNNNSSTAFSTGLSNSNNTSSVSVVVVPLIQNAFDLVDEKSPSAAQMAAQHPIVFTQQNGSHTTMHVVVKRELTVNGSLLPIGEHNAHGPLTDADFLGGGLIAANSSSISSSFAIGNNNSNIAAAVPHSTFVTTLLNASSLRPLINDHGPLQESDSNITVSAAGPLNTSHIVVVQPVEISESLVKLNVSEGDLVTEHVVKTDPVVPHLLNTSILIPSLLVPVHAHVMESPRERGSSDTPAGPPIFFLDTKAPIETLASRTGDEQQKTVEGQTSTESSILAVNVSTLPSAPRVPLVIVEPIPAGRPLTPGTFAFLPLQDKLNKTNVKLFRADE
ncbi:hypothetical protein BV898_18095 [Hypsibius exemplaris]|uniref:Uncharacterized protein n=1 Tax=Hypsibius exemplaris TaxID=2072580 RepID=A0A9X6RMS4_HYPEX|nr:hypothetical protein BV898_18095 [Hypsibius exemplaris]